MVGYSLVSIGRDRQLDTVPRRERELENVDSEWRDFQNGSVARDRHFLWSDGGQARNRDSTRVNDFLQRKLLSKSVKVVSEA